MTGGGSTPSCAQCAPRGVSRRLLLGGGAGAVLIGAAGIELGTDPRWGFAGDGASDTLVVMSLRGGFDGLSAVIPGADPHYRIARPSVGVPASQLLPLNATFGLHPAMAPLLPFWKAGSLAVVQDVGQADPSRSHFDAMRELERAAPGSSVRTGWLDRMLGDQPRGTTFQGAQVGSARLSEAFAGPFPEIALSSIDGFLLEGTDVSSLARTQALYRSLYAGAPQVVGIPAQVAMDAISATTALTKKGYRPGSGVVYPTTGVGTALRDVARLITAGLGVQVACVDVGDWDLHAAMGTVDGGGMRQRLGDLADAVAAFATDLGSRMAGVTLVTLSEFGRRVAENGSGGTDHGHGNTVFVLGGAVAGGKVYGSWPGLAPSALVQGDLPGSTDYRQILAEIMTKRFAVSPVAGVFPGLAAAPMGIVPPRD
jgi:uncharacterized protein (DUF1501 family)